MEKTAGEEWKKSAGEGWKNLREWKILGEKKDFAKWKCGELFGH